MFSTRLLIVVVIAFVLPTCCSRNSSMAQDQANAKPDDLESDEREGGRQREDALERKLALDRVWESSGAGFTDRAECSPTEQSFAVVTDDGGIRICDRESQKGTLCFIC